MMWLSKKFQTLETQYNDPQIYKTTFVFGKKIILNFVHFLPGPPNEDDYCHVILGINITP